MLTDEEIDMLSHGMPEEVYNAAYKYLCFMLKRELDADAAAMKGKEHDRWYTGCHSGKMMLAESIISNDHRLRKCFVQDKETGKHELVDRSSWEIPY